MRFHLYNMHNFSKYIDMTKQILNPILISQNTDLITNRIKARLHLAEFICSFLSKKSEDH